ncbi:MAG: hypothetical protein IRY97_10545 [Thermomicrobiaceae bacterium]|nr:hypothetical protein [Thermomicrobiaceae bacterium]
MSPSLLLSLVIASIYGCLCHSLIGRRLWQLPCYWLASVAGFFCGELFAVVAGEQLFRLGNIPLATATGGALLGLGICWFFTSPLPGPKVARRRRRRRRERPLPERQA